MEEADKIVEAILTMFRTSKSIQRFYVLKLGEEKEWCTWIMRIDRTHSWGRLTLKSLSALADDMFLENLEADFRTDHAPKSKLAKELAKLVK